jgi:nanoRNase/pAp phosphatase (c-di-AMP/oligoRNAs hydrolase)
MGAKAFEGFDIDRALDGVKSRSRALILTHNNPDPDSIAAAEGLRVLLEGEAGLACTLGYGGIVGRAENRAMVNLLEIGLTPLRHMNVGDFDLFALVDTQPGTGNNNLPDDVEADIVIDHHPRRSEEMGAPWTDIRPDVGATTSIVYEYLVKRKVPVDRRLATALLYGIITDTMELGRGATGAEVGAYLDLLPRSDHETLARIRVPNLSFKYYRAVTEAIENAEVFGTQLLSVLLEDVPYPELCAEMADFFIRAQGVHVCFSGGLFGNELHLSLRTDREGMNAGRLIQDVAQPLGHMGGHERMAGGIIDQVPKENARSIWGALCRRLCSELEIGSDPRNFVDLA